MTGTEIKEKIDSIKDKEAFIKNFENVNSAAEIVALFRAEGIDVTEENATAAYDCLKNTGELDESALDSVNGGVVWAIAGVAFVAGSYTLALGTAYALCRVFG